MKYAVGLKSSVMLCMALFAAPGAQADDASELEDAAARGQYAFFTNDIRALVEVLATVADSNLPGRLAPLKTYYLAYGHWKLAQLHSQRAHSSSMRSGAASSAAKACVDYARATTKQDPRMAEAHALQAICEDKPNSFMGLTGANQGSCERHRALRTAMSLAPQNPRVQIIAAMCTRPLEVKQEAERWGRITDSFDTAARPQSTVADWGHAEALTVFAEALLKSGANVEARDAAEKALVIAPDYESARAVLQAISSQPK